MKRKFLTLLFASALAITAHGQAQFGRTLNRDDYNDPSVVLNSEDFFLKKSQYGEKEHGTTEFRLKDIISYNNWCNSYVDIALEGSPASVSFDLSFNSFGPTNAFLRALCGLFDELMKSWSLEKYTTRDKEGHILPSVGLNTDGCDTITAGKISLSSPIFFIQESSDNVSFHETAGFRRLNSDSTENIARANFKTFTAELQPTTRFVRIGYRGNFQGNVRNVKFTALKPDVDMDLFADRRSIDFGELPFFDKQTTEYDSTVTLYTDWKQLGDVRAEIMNASFGGVFSVEPQAVGNPVNDDYVNFVVKAHPMATGTFTALLKVYGKNGSDERVRNLPLTVTCKKGQTISWYDGQDTVVLLYPDPSVTITPATVTEGVSRPNISYKSSDPDVVSYNNSTKEFSINGLGETKITVTVAGNNEWATTTKTKVFVVKQKKIYTTIKDTICLGEDVELCGHTYSPKQDTTIIDSVKTAIGADSIVTDIVKVNPIQKSTETRTMTYGDTFVWNGVNYANKDVDTYKDTIVLESTVTGCDSLVILNLTINKAPQDIFWNLNDENDMFIGNSLTVEAVATSGFEVTLTVTDGTAIKVNGMVVTAIAAGEATLQATVEANKNYEAAEPIEATFTVTYVTALKLLFGNSKDAVKKVLYEGHIYIMTNGKIFNAEGVKIE